MEFEWDENKSQETMLRRGIDFADTLLIWDDPCRQERKDSRIEYGETRYQTIGRGNAGILFVVYTVRIYDAGRLVNRIISARRANTKEIAQYEAKTFQFEVIP